MIRSNHLKNKPTRLTPSFTYLNQLTSQSYSNAQNKKTDYAATQSA